MKLAICSQGKGLEAEVDQRFGRCPFFVIVDPESETVIDSIRNPNAEAAGGAGPQSAQLLIDQGVEAVILGNVGPNAAAALKAAKIKAYSGGVGTVGEALNEFKKGGLISLSESTVSPHFGSRGRG